MVHVNNTPAEDNRCRMNPESPSDIYMTTVKESQRPIVAYDRIKQDEIK